MSKCRVSDCERDAAAKGLCCRCYNRWRRHGDPTIARRMVPRGSSLAERLALLTDRDSEKCWHWKGTLHHSGYGYLKFQGQYRPAHVWAYVEANGEPPPDRPFVLHRCDVRDCVNPEHLYAGTHQQNMDDKVNRRRQVRNAGETSPVRKLSWEQVKEIRRRYQEGGISVAKLAQDYPVSRSAIHLIVTGQRWAEDAEVKV